MEELIVYRFCQFWYKAIVTLRPLVSSHACCECPNMFPWIVPMCNADTIYVHTVNGSLPITVIGLEGICGMVLICSDSATDFLILHPINWEGGRHDNLLLVSHM